LALANGQLGNVFNGFSQNLRHFVEIIDISVKNLSPLQYFDLI